MKLSSFSLFALFLFSVWSFAMAADDAKPSSDPDAITPAEIQQALSNTSKENQAYGPFAKNPACGVDPTDPFDPAYEITYGDFIGECIDASTVRPPILIAQDDHKIEIANFYHNGRYWIANIPKNAVTTVMFQGVPFSSILFGLIKFAHGQFRFKLSRPIELQAQSGDTSVHASLSDFIISSTATHPKGIAYSVFKGSAFGITTRILSTTARAVEEIFQDKSAVHQYQLTMSPENMNNFLLDSITLASEEGYMDRYKLLSDNCATKAFDALDAAIPRPQGVGPMRGHWWEIHDEIEHPALKALVKRHIPYTRVNDLNDEIQCAKPGQKLGALAVTAEMLGAASAQCAFQ